jgi:hypothetical protein
MYVRSSSVIVPLYSAPMPTLQCMLLSQSLTYSPSLSACRSCCIVPDTALLAAAAAAAVHMQVPAKLVNVPIMPRLPNGKIDVKSLAEPEWGAVPGGGSSSGEIDAPESDMEELLAGIWSEELKVGAKLCVVSYLGYYVCWNVLLLRHCCGVMCKQATQPVQQAWLYQSYHRAEAPAYRQGRCSAGCRGAAYICVLLSCWLLGSTAVHVTCKQQLTASRSMLELLVGLRMLPSYLFTIGPPTT